ncbi:MAG TPA: transposase [Actinomycetes bacterium]|nr:transposase [Actinomycetes bacterium]
MDQRKRRSDRFWLGGGWGRSPRGRGVDWGEHHHDLCLLDQDGRVLAAHRIADGLAGAGELHALVAAHAQDPAQVAVGSRPTGACWSALCWPLVTR